MKDHASSWGRLGRERGATLVLVAVGMVMLLGFAALAIDIGYSLVVRNELQNAADAAALGGAIDLFPGTPDPNWGLAQLRASTTIKKNTSDNRRLTGGQVSAGYWNLSGTPPGLQPTTITPGAFDAAAVMVTVRKSAGNNGGPIGLFFAPVLGINTMDVAASAVAVVSPPGSVGQGLLKPIAIAKCLYDNFWDSTLNRPRNDPATGIPYEFKIGSALPYPPCDSAGEWTSFAIDDSSAPAALIASGNPTWLSVRDGIWIEPGPTPGGFASLIGSAVLLPVVPCVTATCASREQQIQGFGALFITDSVGGSGGYVQGHFTTDYRVKVGRGGGPKYGAFSPPSLAR